MAAFDYGKKKEDGQHENYPVNTEGEYVAPIRRTYVHRKCGVATKVSMNIAETYAKNPRYYSHTFCVGCKEHMPINQFEWEDGVTLGEIGVAYPRETTRIEELSEQFKQTGGLSHKEGIELFEKVDIMRKFVEHLASGEKHYMDDVYYDAQVILNKM
jgi:hypothetical protein